MQSSKLTESLNQESEEPRDTPHISRAGMRGHFPFFELFQYAVGRTNKTIGLSTQFLIDTGATNSIINCNTFTENEQTPPLVVMPLTFGSKWTCHAHEKESSVSIWCRRRIQLCYWAHGFCFLFPRGTNERLYFLAKLGKFHILKKPMPFTQFSPASFLDYHPF